MDTISLGQELIINCNFSDSLFDVISQKKYYLPDFNFKTVAVFNKLLNPNTGATQQPGAVKKFIMNNFTGGFSNLSSTYADVEYNYSNHKYQLSTQVIPIDKGVYSVLFYHSTGTKGSTALPQQLAPSEAGVKRFPLMRRIRFIFNNGHTHFNIFKDNCKPIDPIEANNWVQSKSTYTFVVK